MRERIGISLNIYVYCRLWLWKLYCYRLTLHFIIQVLLCFSFTLKHFHCLVLKKQHISFSTLWWLKVPHLFCVYIVPHTETSEMFVFGRKTSVYRSSMFECWGMGWGSNFFFNVVIKKRYTFLKSIFEVCFKIFTFKDEINIRMEQQMFNYI